MSLTLLHRGHGGALGDVGNLRDPSAQTLVRRESCASDKVVHEIRRFLHEMTDPSMAVGMAIGFTAFNSFRALIQPTLLRSAFPLLARVPLVTRTFSATLATVPEVAAIWASSKAIGKLSRPEAVHWDGATAAREMLDLGVTLGFLKSFGFVFGGLGKIGNQAGMLVGIMASQIARDHRAPASLSSFAIDSLITLGHYNAGGFISQALFPRLYRANALLQEKMATQEQAQWEPLRESMEKIFGGARKWIPVSTESMPGLIQAIQRPFLIKGKGPGPQTLDPIPDTKRSPKQREIPKETGKKSPRKGFKYFAERIVLKGSSSLSMKLFSNKPLDDSGQLAREMGDSFMNILTWGKGPKYLLKGSIASQLQVSPNLCEYIRGQRVKKFELQIDVDKQEILKLNILNDGHQIDMSARGEFFLREKSKKNKKPVIDPYEEYLGQLKPPISRIEAFILTLVHCKPGSREELKERHLRDKEFRDKELMTDEKYRGVAELEFDLSSALGLKSLVEKKLLKVTQEEATEGNPPKEIYKTTEMGQGVIRQMIDDLLGKSE